MRSQKQFPHSLTSVEWPHCHEGETQRVIKQVLSSSSAPLTFIDDTAAIHSLEKHIGHFHLLSSFKKHIGHVDLQSSFVKHIGQVDWQSFEELHGAR